MNIFVLDLDPALAARAHCDKHVVKMPTESAQMLCTAIAHHAPSVIESLPFKPSHGLHPCTRWVSASRSNFEWLAELAFALVEEHGRRYPHTPAGRRGHAAGPVILACLDHARRIPAGPITDRPQCVPEACKVPGDPVAAYRRAYAAEKARFARWRAPASPPAWWPLTAP